MTSCWLHCGRPLHWGVVEAHKHAAGRHPRQGSKARCLFYDTFNRNPGFKRTCNTQPACCLRARCRRAAAGVLGLGSYSEEELFRIYVEYQLLCLVDAG